jgi:hypothetical protein
MAAVADYDASIKMLTTGTTENPKEIKDDFQIFSNESDNSLVVKLNGFKQAGMRIFNPMGKLLYTSSKKTDTFTIQKDEIGSKGIVFVEVNGITKKTVVN